jgi:small GTP-binding protein
MQSLEFEKKILLLGDGAVGKTSLVRRFVIDKFADQYIATIGTKTSRKTMQFVFEPEQTTINLHLDIWDILGQTGMERAHKVYFKGAESVIYVCDGTRKETFASIPTWIEEVEKNCGSHLPGVLACNKSDLVSERMVHDDELQGLAADQKLSALRTSAKTGDNVEQAFREIGGFLCGPILAKYGGGKGPVKADEKKKGRFRR